MDILRRFAAPLCQQLALTAMLRQTIIRIHLNKYNAPMNAKCYPQMHQQLHYTCIFLQVSFQAIQRSLNESLPGQGDSKEGNDDTPCWLDAGLIAMLMREMRHVRNDATTLEATRQSLDNAIYHTGLLLAQCPGALNRRLCQHHLQAIISPLQSAAQQLAIPVSAPISSTGWPSAAKRLLGRWRNS